PAAIVVLVVHASDQGTALHAAGNLHPQSTTERLILLDVAGRGNFYRGVGRTDQRVGGDMARLPGDGMSELDCLRYAVCEPGELHAAALGQRQMPTQAVARH